MPYVRVEMIRGRSAEYKRAVLNEIHEALVECFKIPDADRNQIIVEVAPEDFDRPPGRSDQSMVVYMTIFPGRTGDAKRRLYKRIVERLAVNPGIPPDDIMIILQENPMINWGIRGGQAASDVEIGYSVVI